MAETSFRAVFKSKEFLAGLVVAIALAIVAASSSPWWWRYVHRGKQAPQGVVVDSGGCDAFQVFAQNRWAPTGTAVRAAPNIEAHVVATYPGNFSIMVDGWVHSRPAYPTNTAPWNSDIWFHLADDSGWVSFPGVRAEPTATDPTGLSSDGGVPAATSAKCEASVQ